MFYMSVPATNTNPGGEIDVIDPVAMAVTARYPLSNCDQRRGGGHRRAASS
jgi:hypothetical protein